MLVSIDSQTAVICYTYGLGNELDLMCILFLGQFLQIAFFASRCSPLVFASFLSLSLTSILSFHALIYLYNISWNLLCFTVPEFLEHPLHLLNWQLTHLPFSLNTRLCLAYGGSDVSRCFYWLMQRAGFPYRECQLTNKMDCLLLQHLKETFCHLDQVGATSKLLIIFVFRKIEDI